MNGNNTNIDGITIRPSPKQWLILFLPHMLLVLAGCVYVSKEDMPLNGAVSAVIVFLTLYVGYQLLYIRSIKYHISSQQLIVSYGVFHHERNYMELYRVVDFYERRSLMQQLCGLKTITIFSTDRNTPQLRLIGVRNGMDIVGYMRKLVYANRKRMGIHEFSNVNY